MRPVRVDENREGGGAENSQDCLTTNAKPVLWIRDFNPGSEFFHPGSRVKKIPDPRSGPASTNLSIFNPKKLFLSSRKYDPGCSSRIWIPDLDFLSILDPGSSGQKGIGSRIESATLCKTYQLT